MVTHSFVPKRDLHRTHLSSHLVVVGGGLSGVCCAITAARAGITVILAHDRPVLGGNASSEVRLWVLGATSHLGNNNRWAREGGVIDEILLENTWRNHDGNPLLFDALLLEKVVSEPNIKLLLNTAVLGVEKSDDATITSVEGFCSQNSTAYNLSAALFVDASGDGVVGFLAGAAFRMGAESRTEFDEGFAPEKSSKELLGHSLYFYSKDVGRPIKFHPPSFALTDVTRIPRYRDFNAQDYGCRLWWIEWGGTEDTVHATEIIKWELWRVAYGVWNYIKNSGSFPEAENLTLEWVGTIPGKRESRRFEGDYILTQRDIIEQRVHSDAVSFGGWAIDLHPPDGVYSRSPGCQQWHSKGIYQIPYRCLYARDLQNLFLAGRIISASHIAFGSSRVMATCAHSAQAVGMAAVLCSRNGLSPRDLTRPDLMVELQQRLLSVGQHIPGVRLHDMTDLAPQARINVSSTHVVRGFAAGSDRLALTDSWAMLLPLSSDPIPKFIFILDVSESTVLRAELRVSEKVGNFTPDLTLATERIELSPGAAQRVEIKFNAVIQSAAYTFVCLMANPAIIAHLSEERVTGILSVTQKYNRAVAKSPRQEPPVGSGLEAFEFWIPQRRPAGKNLACEISPPLNAFAPTFLTNGFARPTRESNAWVAAPYDPKPTITLTWPTPVTVSRIVLGLDSDFDHPLESVLMVHPESRAPFLISSVRIRDGDGTLLGEVTENHQSLVSIHLIQPTRTSCLSIELTPPIGAPAAIFRVSCYAEASVISSSSAPAVNL